MRVPAQSNPFGSAKPRESVLATRSGKSEQEILAEEAKKGLKVRIICEEHRVGVALLLSGQVTIWRCVPQLRLNGEQRQQKEAAEAAVADLEEQAALEADPDVKAGLEEQIAAGKASLDDLMEAFAVSAFVALCWHTLRIVICGRYFGGTITPCFGCIALCNPSPRHSAITSVQKSTLEAAEKGEVQRPSERRAAQVSISRTLRNNQLTGRACAFVC